MNNVVSNILPSIVEAYNYSEMYNQSIQDGGAEKALAGGMPVQYALQGLYSPYVDSDVLTGGGKNDGSLSDKVVPVGLALINVYPNRNVEFVDNTVNPEIGVLPDTTFDRLFESVSSYRPFHKKRITLKKRIT